MLESISPYFKNQKKTVLSSMLLVLEAMIKTCSSNTSTLAKSISALKNCSYKNADMTIYRLLQNPFLQIDDKFWRGYIKLIFAMMKENFGWQKGQKININIDITTDERDFLILCASINCDSRDIPIYFSMRDYPRNKNQYDHKKLELAFLKALKHILSDKYQYVIVADRGFGNKRFFDNCEELGFEYLIRIQPNMKIEIDKNQGIANQIMHGKGKYEVKVVNWDKKLTIFKQTKDEKEWYLVSNIKELELEEAVSIYKNRFKIEKCFQDLKSSGFDIEGSKVKKYDRFKRLLAMVSLAYSFLVLTGKFINEKLPHIKKNSPIFISLLTASSSLEKTASNFMQSKL